MKKLLSFALVLALIVSLCACGAGVSAGPKNANDNVTIEGIYVDDSYVKEEGSPLKRVYMFLNVTATDENLKVDSGYFKMTIGENSYDSAFSKGACDYAPSYYYSSYIEDLYVGNSQKLALTFEVPSGDLVAGKEISFYDSDLPVDDLKMTTDDIVTCANAEEVCKLADPDGYAVEADKHAPADEATVKQVSGDLNGYYWEFQVAVGTMIQNHELEFYAPNEFELRTTLGSNGGTYEVKKAFIYITYSTNNHTVKIPYEYKDGELYLHCSTAFSIYE